VYKAPVIPLADRVALVPLVGALDQEHLHAVQAEVLREIERLRANTALVDLTGTVSFEVDASDALEQLQSAMRLLGCRVIVTGARGPVARALTERSSEVRIETRRDLRAGLAYALGPSGPDAGQPPLERGAPGAADTVAVEES
jgi:anti-anti-sigma regulatory factor